PDSSRSGSVPARSSSAPRDVMSLATSELTAGAPRAAPVSGGAHLRRRYVVRGVVQGVGFRPFVWTLATRLGLIGSVCNTSGGVIVEVEGKRSVLERFAEPLQRDAPRLAHVDAVE